MQNSSRNLIQFAKLHFHTWQNHQLKRLIVTLKTDHHLWISELKYVFLFYH